MWWSHSQTSTYRVHIIQKYTSTLHASIRNLIFFEIGDLTTWVSMIHWARTGCHPTLKGHGGWESLKYSVWCAHCLTPFSFVCCRCELSVKTVEFWSALSCLCLVQGPVLDKDLKIAASKPISLRRHLSQIQTELQFNVDLSRCWLSQERRSHPSALDDVSF